MALNYLEEQIAKKAPFTKELILKVQSIVEKGHLKKNRFKGCNAAGIFICCV